MSRHDIPRRNGRILWTADTHFGHRSVLTFKGQERPFPTIEEHDEALIECWNATVQPNDQIWHLGDFAYKCHPQRMQQIFKRLNGQKCIVLGNHDTRETMKLGWDWVGDFAMLSVDGLQIVMSHYGMRTWPGQRYGAIMLYGHSHGRLPGARNTLDVGVDSWGYCPIQLPQILERMATLPMVKFSKGEPVEALDDIEEETFDVPTP